MFIPFLFAVVLSFIAVQSNDSTKTYRINIGVPGGRINEDVVVDSSKNTMTVNVGGVSHLNNSFCPSINLHDFETKKVAIKNIDYGSCIVVDTKEYYSDSVDLLEKITRIHYRHEIKNEIMVRAHRISHDTMLKIAGEKIADFCQGYKLYVGEKVNQDGMLLAVENEKSRKKRRALGMKMCNWACVFCLVAQV